MLQKSGSMLHDLSMNASDNSDGLGPKLYAAPLLVACFLSPEIKLFFLVTMHVCWRDREIGRIRIQPERKLS